MARGRDAPAPSRAPVGLDVDDIATAALALIDEHGVWAFTMRALSDQLGVSAPTIYWHVGSKTGVFEAVITKVLGEMSVATSPKRLWDVRLRQFLDTAHGQLLAHPGILELLSAVHSPGMAGWGA